MAKQYAIIYRTPEGIHDEPEFVRCDSFNDLPKAIFEQIIKTATACPIEILRIELIEAMAPIAPPPASECHYGGGPH